MLQAGQLLAVGGDEKFDHLGFGAAGERDGQRVIAGNRAWLAGADGDVVSPGAR